MNQISRNILFLISEFTTIPQNINKYLKLNDIEKWYLIKAWFKRINIDYNNQPDSKQLNLLYILYINRELNWKGFEFPSRRLTEKLLEYHKFSYAPFVFKFIQTYLLNVPVLNLIELDRKFLSLADLILKGENHEAWNIVKPRILNLSNDIAFKCYVSYYLICIEKGKLDNPIITGELKLAFKYYLKYYELDLEKSNN